MSLTSIGDQQWAHYERDARVTLRRLAAALAPMQEQGDLLQDTLLQCWRARSTFDPDRGSFATWAGAIMRNLWSARRRTDPGLSVHGDERIEFPTQPADLESLMDLRVQVNDLPTRQREVVVLHHYVGYPVAEIAIMLGIAVGSVKSALHDARQSLAKGMSR